MKRQRTIALLPSALLGPSVWLPVQEELARAGWDVLTADPSGVDGTSFGDIQQGYLGCLPTGAEYHLVAHSNAGLYVPGLTEHRSVSGIILVDAILPPRRGSVPVAPEGLQTMLRDLAGVDGELPPWTSWWSKEDVAALFPSDEVRTQVAAEQRCLPMSYFEETVAIAPGWDDVPTAFVAFGDNYEPERKEAEKRGWRTQTIDGAHLHMLTAPHNVSAEIDRLCSA